MSATGWALIGAGVVVFTYLGLLAVLLLTGRRQDARALAGFVPDCVILFRRLLGDRRISGWRRAALLVLVAYLLMPIDLVPDFIPVAGQLDDALIAALVLRIVLRAGGPELIREHWPGPPASVELVIRLAYGRSARA